LEHPQVAFSQQLQPRDQKEDATKLLPMVKEVFKDLKEGGRKGRREEGREETHVCICKHPSVEVMLLLAMAPFLPSLFPSRFPSLTFNMLFSTNPSSSSSSSCTCFNLPGTNCMDDERKGPKDG